MTDKKILCVVSARGGSSGVPRKNLKSLGGRPLVSYVIETAQKSKYIDRLICNTEDEEIAKVAHQYGAEIPFQRDPSNATSDIPLTASTKYAMEKMSELGFHADIVLQLAPTCPFIKAESIDIGIERLLETNCDSVASLKRIEHEHPYRALDIVDNDILVQFLKDIDVESFQQRQDLPTLYCTSGALYIRQRHVLENWSGRDFAFGKTARGLFLDDIQAVNIDRPIDFQFAEFLFQQLAQGKLSY